MTDQELKNIEARYKKATEGPWYKQATPDIVDKEIMCFEVFGKDDEHDDVSVCHTKYCDEEGLAEFGHHDFDFIAHARTDIPTLIEALKQERVKRAELKDMIERVEDDSEKTEEKDGIIIAELQQRVEELEAETSKYENCPCGSKKQYIQCCGEE